MRGGGLTSRSAPPIHCTEHLLNISRVKCINNQLPSVPIYVAMETAGMKLIASATVIGSTHVYALATRGT